MAFQLTEDNFDETINSGKTVLVDFWAEWCAPCKMLNPTIKELEDEMDSEKVTIAKCDIQNQQALATKYGIMSIPSILIFKEGEVKEQIIGVVPKQDIKEKLKPYID
ncbi:MAG: thioredoxin [Candidatus Cloacimonetes bacterium]|nr:thioredoxin [Candidatus Cloacimonadota bacterium]